MTCSLTTVMTQFVQSFHKTRSGICSPLVEPQEQIQHFGQLSTLAHTNGTQSFSSKAELRAVLGCTIVLRRSTEIII